MNVKGFHGTMDSQKITFILRMYVELLSMPIKNLHFKSGCWFADLNLSSCLSKLSDGWFSMSMEYFSGPHFPGKH